jgi:hypothetical protein
MRLIVVNTISRNTERHRLFTFPFGRWPYRISIYCTCFACSNLPLSMKSLYFVAQYRVSKYSFNVVWFRRYPLQIMS